MTGTAFREQLNTLGSGWNWEKSPLSLMAGCSRGEDGRIFLVSSKLTGRNSSGT